MKEALEIFVNALKDGLQLCKAVKEILNAANEIASGTEEALLNMTKEAAAIAKEESSIFREALRTAKESGNALLARYDNFRVELEQLERFTVKVTRVKVISEEDFAQGHLMLQSILLHAKNCFKNYPVYKDKLWKAIDIGTRLAERCKVEGQKAKNDTDNARTLGYSTTGALGVVAAGFLVFATGGVAGLGAAAFGLSALGAGAKTRNLAKEMDSVADEIRKLQDKLDRDVSDLNRCADKIEHHNEMTRVMVEELEINIKLAQQARRPSAATNYAYN